MDTVINDKAVTSIIPAREMPAVLRRQFPQDALVRVTVETVDANGLTDGERRELFEAMADAEKGVDAYGPFQTVTEMFADIETRLARGD